MLETEVEIAHRWQAHRTRCLKLAVKAGAGHQNLIEVADLIGAYILTKSVTEKAADIIRKEQT